MTTNGNDISINPIKRGARETRSRSKIGSIIIPRRKATSTTMILVRRRFDCSSSPTAALPLESDVMKSANETNAMGTIIPIPYPFKP